MTSQTQSSLIPEGSPKATQALTVGDIIIRQHGGLFSLNDLHKASGGEEKRYC